MLCKNQYNVGLFNDMRGFSRQMTKMGYLYIYWARNKLYIYIQSVSRLVDITAGDDFLGLCEKKFI